MRMNTNAAHKKTSMITGCRSLMTCLMKGVLICAVLLTQSYGQERIATTVHNLSAGGPGVMRAASEQQICIFCHAPHNTLGLQPLWNRQLSAANYQIYTSSTLDAQPGQPTGSSKLCLSCHDGTIALGSVLSRADQIRMLGGDFLPSGLTNLGTDLSDDHPISFHYTSGIAASDLQLKSPQALPAETKLDPSGQLQCTSCHDAHNNTFGDFLVLDPRFGNLCTACHLMNSWTGSSHQISNATVSSATLSDWPFTSVAENACRSCHRSHTAGGKQRLLLHAAEEDNCLNCHDGSVANTNILAAINKFSSHDPRNDQGTHDPTEGAFINQAHVECVDCHNPHAVTTPTPTSTYIPIGATLMRVVGVSIGGTLLDESQYEYEVCLKCHGNSAVDTPSQIFRQAHTTDLRLKFQPGNPSYHPVAASSPSSDTISLIPGLPQGTLLRCTDCHNNNDGPRNGGSGPDGPHGSSNEYMLERNYTTSDNIPESQTEYDLCYKCHRRSSILSDESFKEHRKHIVKERTPCSACHDPHGVSQTIVTGSDHTHLINFDTTIVRPEPSSGLMMFKDNGTFAGSCTLICHGEAHRDEAYP